MLSAGCAGAVGQSASERRLAPIDGDIRTSGGRQIVMVNAGGVGYEISFDRYTDDLLTFTLRVTNGGGAPLEVSPGEFFYLASRDTAGPTTKFNGATKSFAMNPAQERASIDTMLAMEQAAAASAGDADERSAHEESLGNLRRLRSRWEGVVGDTTLGPGAVLKTSLVFFPRPEFRTVKVFLPKVETPVTFKLME